MTPGPEAFAPPTKWPRARTVFVAIEVLFRPGGGRTGVLRGVFPVAPEGEHGDDSKGEVEHGPGQGNGPSRQGKITSAPRKDA